MNKLNTTIAIGLLPLVLLAASPASATGTSKTALSTAPTTSTVGQNVTLTASVSSASGSACALNGTVTFTDTTTNATLGTKAVSAGAASLTTVFAVAETHALKARYNGDTGSAPACGTSQGTAKEGVNAATSSMALTVSGNPVPVSSALTLTATVLGYQPTGQVQFTDNGTNLGAAVALNGGVASTAPALQTAGRHSYGAAYSGDAGNAASSTSVNVNVTAVPTATAASAPTSAVAGQSVTLSATVNGPNPGGKVTFYEGAKALGTATPLTSGVATQAVQFAAGLHTLVASYSGDATTAPSVSQAVQLMASSDGSALPPAAPMQWRYGYDAEGNLTSAIDGNGATTTILHDSLARPMAVTLPASSPGASPPVIGTTFDLSDRPATVTDPRSTSAALIVTKYATNGLGETTSVKSPDTGTTTNTFYDDGLLYMNQDGAKHVATYSYDSLDRVTSIAYTLAGGTTTSPSSNFTYDTCTLGVGRLCSVSDESGSTAFTYDGFGHVTSKTQVVTAQSVTQTFAVGYAWGSSGTANGKLQSITYPSGAQVTYSFDAAGRVDGISVTSAGGTGPVLSGLSYTALGQPLSWLWGDGTLYQRGYDGYGRLASYPLGNPAGSGISAGTTRTVSYDAAGRIVGYTHAGPATTIIDQAFFYDGLDHLTGVTQSGLNYDYGYGYDASGNRTSWVINGTSYALTPSATSNQYASVQTASGTYFPGYLASGQLKSDLAGSYTYSDRGRMQSAKIGANTVNYLYNAFEQRVVKWGPAPYVDSGRVYYVYDEAGHVLGEYDVNKNPIFETVYLGDVPVASITFAGTLASVAFVYADHLNTPRVIVRSGDQAILWQWGSDEPFGYTLANANPNKLGTYVFDQRFPGQVYDSESGWLYNWHRDYDPSQGRYKQSDPIGLAGGSMTTYGYVNASPLEKSDATGLTPWDWNGPGSTAVCVYYDQMSKAHPKCSYYKNAANTCRGQNPWVNSAITAGISQAWMSHSTSASEAAVLESVRSALIEADKKARSDGKVDCNTDCVFGNDIDAYHDAVFAAVGLSPAFYGGNLWKQGVYPNYVPQDPRGDPTPLYTPWYKP